MPEDLTTSNKHVARSDAFALSCEFDARVALASGLCDAFRHRILKLKKWLQLELAFTLAILRLKASLRKKFQKIFEARAQAREKQMVKE